MYHTMALPCFGTAIAFASAAQRPSQRTKKKKLETKQSGVNTSVGFGAEKKELSWKCVQGCGACCKLDKGPAFASPEEIFANPQDVEYYRSLIGPDGWCIHYEKTTRQCSIYSDRPYFCRVEPEIFETLYGINKKKFNKEACSCCTDTIKAIYGPNSKELNKFNKAVRSYPSPFHGNYEEPDPLPPATTLPYPGSPFHWSYLDGSISSLHNREDLDFTCDPQIDDEYQDDQWQSSGSGDWLSSCFQEDASCGYEYGYSFQNEEPGSESYCQQVENQSGFDYSPWSWTGAGAGAGAGAGEEYSYGYQRTEPGATYRNSSDEITGLCESFLGYWPCLLREYQKTYGDQ